MNMILNFLFASVGPWLAMKMLKPDVLAQLGYDVVNHWVKKTPSPDDDKFLAHVADYLELKKD